MTTTTKQEIFKEKLQEYLLANKQGKGLILDAVSAVTRCDRKSAIRRFKTIQLRPRFWQECRGRKRVYDHRTTTALKEVWEAANRICAERLHPVIPEYIRILKRDGMWKPGEETTSLLLQA